MPRRPAGEGGWVDAARYVALGVEMVVAVVVGLVVGGWLDAWLGTGPWLTLLLALLGSVAGFRTLVRAGRRWAREEDERSTRDRSSGPSSSSGSR